MIQWVYVEWLFSSHLELPKWDIVIQYIYRVYVESPQVPLLKPSKILKTVHFDSVYL